MGGDRTIRGLVATSPRAARAVRAIVASWRGLSGGEQNRDEARKTLVACSGGVDSAALALALSSATTNIVVAHVLHDMRPRAAAEASRDAASLLAQRLGLPFVHAEVSAKDQGGNYEGRARTVRYEALSRLAREHACPFIATAHHREDQLETMLMRLLRGSGPRGLSGLARSRPLDAQEPTSSRLIRPMLGVSRQDASEICRAAGTTWVEDETNLDTRSLRNALRHRVLPILAELAPSAGEAAVASADLMRQASALVGDEARKVLDLAEREVAPHPGFRWAREALRQTLPIVLGEVLHQAAAALGVHHGADQRGSRSLAPILAAMRDESTEPRQFTIGGLHIRVTAHTVTIGARSLPSVP